jgi:hypothetical protein
MIAWKVQYNKYKGIKEYRERHKKSNNDILERIYKLSDVIRE